MENKWQKIETAPKDGSEILLCVPLSWGSFDREDLRIGSGNYIVAAWWDNNNWKTRLDHRMKPNPAIFWMPLPQPPEEEND